MSRSISALALSTCAFQAWCASRVRRTPSAASLRRPADRRLNFAQFGAARATPAPGTIQKTASRVGEKRGRRASTQSGSSSVSSVPSQLLQRPGCAGARLTGSDRPHITQYMRSSMRAARRAAARSSAGASAASSSSRCAPFRRAPGCTFSPSIVGHAFPNPESTWLERHDSDSAGPVNTRYALRSAGNKPALTC
jgi:hypothetical protein